MNEIIELFKESMGRLSSGVTVVMTEVGGRPWGLTVSACCSISMKPPLILISLATETASTAAIIEHQRFGVSILSADQVDVAKAGAQAGAPKYFEEYVHDQVNQTCYSVKDALANIHCKVDNVVVAGDHTLFLGLVEDVTLGELKQPLEYFHRQFGTFTPDIAK